MKICSKCKIEKDLSGFHKDKTHKDGLRTICKECSNEYSKKRYENNPDYSKKYSKKWHENNPDYSKQRYENNPEYWKTYHNSKANYDTFSKQIFYAEKVKNVDGFLQVKCAHCRKWYFPTNREIQNRISALNSSDGYDGRLYCSEECKIVCPIYKKKKFQQEHPMKNENLSREVQSELRQLVFERDEYTCIKCGKHQDELTVPLHCHHIEGIRHNPIMSADIDMCVTVCKDCHKEIHQQKGCGYNDMQCKTNENMRNSTQIF